MNCLICLSDFEQDKKYKCCDPRCMEHLCKECVVRYIEISSQENTLITCPRESCMGVFTEETFGDLGEVYIEKYRKAIYEYYKLSKTTEITEHHKASALHAILKEERTQFMLNSMPKAVLKVAKIAFGTKLNKVKKIQIERNTHRVSRLCFNLVCNGFLDENCVCGKCKSTFCKVCEEPLEKSHVCNPDIIESVKMIREMVKCPSCGVNVEKGEGCDAITCAVCKTNFWYTTRQKGEAGNHGQFADVRLISSRKVSTEYREWIPQSCIDKIREFEQELVTDTHLEQKMASILLQERPQTLAPFSKLYSKITMSNINKNICSKKLLAIEAVLKKRDENYVGDIEKILN